MSINHGAHTEKFHLSASSHILSVSRNGPLSSKPLHVHFGGPRFPAAILARISSSLTIVSIIGSMGHKSHKNRHKCTIPMCSNGQKHMPFVCSRQATHERSPPTHSPKLSSHSCQNQPLCTRFFLTRCQQCAITAKTKQSVAKREPPSKEAKYVACQSAVRSSWGLTVVLVAAPLIAAIRAVRVGVADVGQRDAAGTLGTPEVVRRAAARPCKAAPLAGQSSVAHVCPHTRMHVHPEDNALSEQAESSSCR